MECLTCSENLEVPRSRDEGLNAQPAKKIKIDNSDPAQSISCVTPCGHLFHRECLYQHFESDADGNSGGSWMPWSWGSDNPDVPTGGNCPECGNYVKSADLYPVFIIRKGRGGAPRSNSSNDKRPGGTGLGFMGEPPSMKSEINELKARIIELEEKLEAMEEEMEMKTALLESLTEERLQWEEEEAENEEDEDCESGEEEQEEEEFEEVEAAEEEEEGEDDEEEEEGEDDEEEEGEEGEEGEDDEEEEEGDEDDAEEEEGGEEDEDPYNDDDNEEEKENEEQAAGNEQGGNSGNED